jgi:hypothetical protein
VHVKPDIAAAISALAGVTQREWEIIKAYVDREFEAEARKLELTPVMAEQAQRRMASEQDVGKAVPLPEGNKQQRMW